MILHNNSLSLYIDPFFFRLSVHIATIYKNFKTNDAGFERLNLSVQNIIETFQRNLSRERENESSDVRKYTHMLRDVFDPCFTDIDFFAGCPYAHCI